MLKDDGTPINQESPGLLRLLTPAGGAQVREYADVTNAATVGTIEIGKSFNVAINTTTGVWAGRDATGECWLEKWTDTGATKEYWYAASATAGVVPTWVKTHSVDVTTGKTTVAAATSQTQAVNGSQLFGFRNKIINGNFDIRQRGTSQSTTGYGSADRWYCNNVGTTKVASLQTFTLGQTEVPGNPKYFMRHAVTSVAGIGNNCSMNQYIEFVSTLAGNTATLTFWAKADAAKNIAVGFDQDFGTGGSPSAPVLGIGAQLVPLTTAWQKISITLQIPSITGKTMGATTSDGALTLVFWFDAGSNYNAMAASLGQQSGTFDIAQVQLEEGSLATRFEQRSYGDELALCLRYYETSAGQPSPIWSGSVTSGSTYYHTHFYKVFKRATPTLSIGANSVTGFSATLVTDANNLGGFQTNATSNLTTSAGYFQYSFIADAEL